MKNSTIKIGSLMSPLETLSVQASSYCVNSFLSSELLQRWHNGNIMANLIKTFYSNFTQLIMMKKVLAAMMTLYTYIIAWSKEKVNPQTQ